MHLLPTLQLLILVATSVFTSALSAATGMGGGILLFSVMTLFFPFQVLIPVHGVIQLFNNLFILAFLRKHLRQEFILPFLAGAVVGICGGALVVNRVIKTDFPQIVIVILIAYSLLRPKWFPALDVKPPRFLWVGLLTGFFGIIAGAIDPILGPFFVRNDLNKEEVIANKAMMQAIVHFGKVPVFWLLGFDYAPYVLLCVITNIACFFGTKAGVAVLNKMSEKAFILVFRTALAATGLRLIYRLL